MIRTFLFFGFLFGQLSTLFGQLTIKVTSIPVNTPSGASIHIAGSFNNWNENDATKILAPIGGGQYSITLTPNVGTVEFKFTRGTWAAVEGGAGGGFQANHQVQYTGQAKTVELPILSWEDLGGSNPGGGTAAPNVSILSDNFYLPQLNRERRIWLYLPPDYQTSTKKYPVLYLQDGQNLFDDNTSFSGEWKVDESLNALFDQGDYGCIVVGIDNGGAYRLDEYSPWVNPQYGGGQGDEYLDFIVNTLKPHMDANYRTLPDRLHTGVGGSSMGALFAEYALIERQDVFSKAAVFSPAFWFADAASANHVSSTGKQADLRTYFLAGGSEPAYVESDMANVADAMLGVGFAPEDIYFEVPADGQHSEWFWAREFPAAYVWLFQNSVSVAPESGQIAMMDFEVFPNPAGDWLRWSGTNLSKNIDYQVVGTDGKIWDDRTLRPGEPIWTGNLPQGLYFLEIKEAGKTVGVKRFAVQGF